MNYLYTNIVLKLRNSPRVLPALMMKIPPQNTGVISFNIRQKSTSNKKWRGRLEYLNREDPSEKSKSVKNNDNDIKMKEKSMNKNNRVYLWGNGELGALGQLGFLHPKAGRTALYKMRRPFVSSLSNYCNVRSAACGYGYTLFVTDHREKYLFGTGLNDCGQLGHQRRLNPSGGETGGALEMVIVPSVIRLPLHSGEKVVEVAGGRAHSLALTSAGRVLAWGHNGYGQCGRAVVEGEDYLRARVVHSMAAEGLEGRLVAVVAGQDHSLALSSCGSVWSCGWGADGQTGLGHYNNTASLSRLRGDIAGERIVKLSCAADCVLALSERGEVFCWGNSEYGQLRTVTSEQQVNLPTLLPTPGLGRVVDVASGGTVCLLLTEDGQVWVWGWGILGKGPALESSLQPTALPQTLFGTEAFGDSGRVRSVHAGLSHQAAITEGGDLYIWGRNRAGCLGLHTDQDRYFPLKVPIGGKVKQVSLGVDHTVAIVKPWMSK